MKNAVKSTQRITAATLALALGVAVYLNWQYARTGADAVIAADSEAAAVAAGADDVAITVSDQLMTEQETLEAANKNYGEAQLVSVSKDSGSEFFEQARLDRTKTRDGAIDDIENSLKKSSLSSEEKEKLTAQLTQYLEDVTAEGEIETLIKAKGFADCLCFLQDGKADITVMTSSGSGLDASQVAQIRDVVLSRRSELTAQDITVVEVK